MRTTDTVDFSKYETDAHNYGGSDSKKSIYFDGKYYMIKMPNEIQTDNSLQTSISNNVISEYIGSHIMQSILDKSFEILNELDEVKNNHDFYYSRHKDKINYSTAKKHKKKGSDYPDLD